MDKVTIEISREAAEFYNKVTKVAAPYSHQNEIIDACRAALSKDKRYWVSIFEYTNDVTVALARFDMTREQLERQSKKPIYDECVEGLPAEFLTHACRKVLENE